MPWSSRAGRLRRGLAAALAGGALAVAPLAPIAATATSASSSSTASVSEVVGDGDAAGTSWFPHAGISPAEVNEKDFGQLFDVSLPSVNGVPAGQVYAQPLIAGGVLLVVTENDNAYGLNPVTGSVIWSRNFGTAWPTATINCGDLAPNDGITGTPVVDSATGTAYFVTDTTAGGGAALWQMQAVSVATGAEAAAFPVTIAGDATNDPGRAFDPTYQLQRPGLALVGSQVFAAFGAHCDLGTWYGWIAGVTTSGLLRNLFVDETGTAHGAGVWAPGGIATDGSGNLYVATGNGGPPDPGPAVTDATGLGECVVRLSTSAQQLGLSGYFCPSGAVALNQHDGDLGSGSPTLLPSSFGTTSDPNLLVEVGKSGEVYLLERDALGGFENGPGGSDDVVQEVGPRGGVWSHPAVWPGDGGYVYIETASASGQGRTGGDLDVYQREVEDGSVSLAWVGQGPVTQFGSGIPIVTSDGTKAGSAIVWSLVKSSPTATTESLEAMGAVPVAGTGDLPARLPTLFTFDAGEVAKFAEPLASGGRIYVATLDGQVESFGVRSAPPVTGSALAEADTVVGSSTAAQAVFTAIGAVTIDSATITVRTPGAAGAFSTPALSAPVTLAAGGRLRLPVVFAPQIVGGQKAKLTVTTNLGTAAVTVSGRGLAEGQPIAASPISVTFPTQPLGGTAASSTVAFENASASSLTVTSAAIESGASAPFAVGVLPSPLPAVAPGGSFDIPVTFTPPATSGDFVQHFDDHLVVSTTEGSITVPLAGSAAPPPLIAISDSKLSAGSVALGQKVVMSFLVSNRGGTPLTITKSKPPVAGGFRALTSLPEGTVIPAHASLVETVRFRPRLAGTTRSVWVINGNDSSGLQHVVVTGTGVAEPTVPPPPASGWRLRGAAEMGRHAVVLTPIVADSSGSAIYGRSVPTSGLRATFDLRMAGGSGGDGATFFLAPRGTASRAPGRAGAGLGLAGMNAVGVGFQLRPTSGNRIADSVGIVTASAGSRTLAWSDVVAIQPPLEGRTVEVSVTVSAGSISVSVDGFVVTSGPVTVAPEALVGFSGSTGHRTDRVGVSGVEIWHP